MGSPCLSHRKTSRLHNSERTKPQALHWLPHYGSSHQRFNLDCRNLRKEVQFPAPLVLLLLSQLWFTHQLLPPCRRPPSSLFYLQLVAFCYFLSSLIHFRPLLIRLLVGRIVHFVKMSFFPNSLNCWTFFPPWTNVNVKSPETALLDPSNFWEIHGNPIRIFFGLLCFMNTFDRV
jgi:hypothetical protein